jgi:hypothetical protein
MEQILARLEEPLPSGERLRSHRALAVLEYLGTPQAREVLTALGRGAPEVFVTREARAAAERLARQAAEP